DDRGPHWGAVDVRQDVVVTQQTGLDRPIGEEATDPAAVRPGRSAVEADRGSVEGWLLPGLEPALMDPRETDHLDVVEHLLAADGFRRREMERLDDTVRIGLGVDEDDNGPVAGRPAIGPLHTEPVPNNVLLAEQAGVGGQCGGEGLRTGQ